MDWRRVVTGHHEGKPAIVLDASIPTTSAAGSTRSGPILTLDRWPSSADDGEPGPEPEAPAGGGTRIVALELEASSGWIDRPERGRSATLDVYVVVAGELVVGLDDGETTLRSGEVLGEEDDPIVALADAWETGGPVASVDQGGDATPPWQLEPRARGLKVLNLEMMPTDTGPGSGDEGWHATNTIDVDIVIDGAVELYLPELPRSACPLATSSYSGPRTTAGVPPETVTCAWSPS
jgi:hypothetical protein